MKAVIKPVYNENRVNLSEVIPLDTPFSVYISPSQCCNFKCFYCSHSLGTDNLKNCGYPPVNMDNDLFIKITDQLLQFPNKIKLVQLTGIGEPFLNPNLPQMIRTLNEKKICERVGVYSNGALLTKDVTDSLRGTGLSQLALSIQGLSSEKYKQVAGVDIDFNSFIKNIEYFYRNKEGCKLYIKIIDSVISPEEEEKFYKIFGDISDEIYIEHLIRSQHAMGDMNRNVDSSLTLFQEKTVVRDVCPVLFYSLQIDSTGRVFPCLQLTLPKEFSLGNVFDNTLTEMWNGEKLRNLRLLHLKGNRYSYNVCANCDGASCITHESDNLDNAADVLIKKFSGEIK